MDSGTYKVQVGDHYYFGSSWALQARRRSHHYDLRNDQHPCPKLQAVFNSGGKFSFTILEEIGRMPGEGDKQFRARLRASEQLLLDAHQGMDLLCNRSESSMGPGKEHAEKARALWKNPEFREKMKVVIAKKIRENPVSAETRKLQGDAKRGAANVNAKAVRVTSPDGTVMEFETETAVAIFFGVSQQLMHMWLVGPLKWPGETARPQYRWIAAYRAEHVIPQDRKLIPKKIESPERREKREKKEMEVAMKREKRRLKLTRKRKYRVENSHENPRIICRRTISKEEMKRRALESEK